MLLAAFAALTLFGCGGTSSNSQSSNQTSNSAVGQLTINPQTMNFGNVAVGSSNSQNATLTAGGLSVAVTSAAWNGQGYSLSGITFPVTIAAGRSVPFTVTFAPQTTGSSSGSITFESNASNSPAIETLSGTGTQTTQHNVALTWTSSTSLVAGYNIYRGTQSGGPYAKLNSSLLPSTNYTDASVQSGATYFYVTTAVDSSDVESAYSNQAQAVIPNP
jgi:hypothetical protein